MKIFIDTADVEEIKRLNDIGIIDGVTTNPSLIAKEGRNFEQVVKEITEIVDGPISAEAVSLDAEGMIKEGKELSKIHKNIIIKVPMTSEGIKAVKVLEAEGIKCNVTLTFSANQAILAAKAGASFVSPFVGRLDDIGEKGMDVIKEIVEIYKNYNFKTEIIVASVRNLEHVKESGMLGAHIATIPPKLINEMFKHELTDKGIKKFLEDWEKVKDK
ncbi:fructose-6-phosphate aldolase [Candidatus Woesearchaeota archaeon]|jgi:transaldolase|nr:fructose-6-phosphate aldolase [Candidatus Woesearchaeota archaeon]